MELLNYVLSAAVLAALVFTMLFFTQVIKNKDNKRAKDENLRKAGVAFFAYLALNLLRLWVEGQFL
ncbi:MAG: hypothetical protein IKC09_01620 [Oscillospiraceae bacterium]|nr:hypothetical protein [Oscillospiraceae bacterium]